MKRLIGLFVTILTLQYCYSQDNVFVIGNIDNISIQERLVPFEKMLENEKEQFTLLIVGNIGQDLPENEKLFLTFLKKVENTGSKVLIVTGERDWNNGKETIT